MPSLCLEEESTGFFTHGCNVTSQSQHVLIACYACNETLWSKSQRSCSPAGEGFVCMCKSSSHTFQCLIFPRTLTFSLPTIHLCDQNEAEEMVLCPSADGMKREGKRWRKWNNKCGEEDFLGLVRVQRCVCIYVCVCIYIYIYIYERLLIF